MKSKNPFFSIKPSGSFAKTLVASNYRGKPYVSITHKPGGKASGEQRAVRDRFLQAKDAWLVLPEIDKEVYNDRARLMPLTGYNLFIKEFNLDMIKSITKLISSAEILDIVGNPVIILPAPPVGKYYVPLVVIAKLNYNSVAYSLDGDYFGVGNGEYPGGAFTPSSLADLIRQEGDLYVPQFIDPLTFSAEGQTDIVLASLENNPTDGDSSLSITILYVEFDL